MRIEAKNFPQEGRSGDELLAEMSALRDEDVRWHEGRVWSLVFHAGDELSDFLKQAYGLFFSENGLNPTAFPSLRRFEIEVVSMVAGLLGGDAKVVGNMTSGGTESILMAVKTAREWGRKRGKHGTLEIVLPVSAHPAFEKAAHYFGVKTVHVPVGKDYRVDLKAMRKAISRRTILLVGSAPQYPQGVV
ncbi:MAG: aspartate aminotransferase family protein, partial [Deltaproteobacteria bacterium]|nr:aspartate aminotransferase family protein [Deltaproteobacteria bacterium]